MTQPKMIQCGGSGHEVYEPDEPLIGTVQCLHPNCGRSDLRTEIIIVDGKERYFVPEHKRRINPLRRKGGKTAPSYGRKYRRDSSRRQ
jgi:hypothetical protein